MNTRNQRLVAAAREYGAQAALITAAAGIYYFSGFTGEGCLVVSESACVLITDSRYTEAAQKQAPGFDVREYKSGQYNATIARAVKESAAGQLLIEGDEITYAQYTALESALDGVSITSATGLCAKLRVQKDAEEIDIIRKASDITDLGFAHALKITRPGMTEKELATDIAYYFAKTHGSAVSFPFIVASGVNGSMPHAEPGDKVLVEGEMITLDFGAEYHGYRSDMTRTYSLGTPSDKMREIYGIVLEAQEAAEAAVKPGAKCAEVDKIARDIITNAGYGDCFGHGLGHGVGIEIHEAPRLSPLSGETLAPGMIVTVEPGIYLPGIGGVRIENTCLVTENGCEPLFKSDKKMIVL